MRAPWNLVARRLGVLLAAGALVLAALASAGAGRDGGYSESVPPRIETLLPRIEVLGWLRYSRQSFRVLMDMLAERSARLQRTPRPPSRIAAPPDADHWVAPPPRRRSPPPGPLLGPSPDADEEPEERWQQPRRPRHGGEAAAGPNRTRAVQANMWREPRGGHWGAHRGAHWGARCRKAGVEVEGAGWYVVRAGDTLWSIAEMHYGNGEAYRRILRANWQRIADADHLQPCQRLYIPRWGSPRPPDEEDWRRPAPAVPSRQAGSRGPSMASELPREPRRRRLNPCSPARRNPALASTSPPAKVKGWAHATSPTRSGPRGARCRGGPAHAVLRAAARP